MINNDQQLKWSRDVKVEIPSVDKDNRIAILKRDWQRIRKLLEGIPKPNNWPTIVYSALLGLASSSFLSFLSTKDLSGMHLWIPPVFLCITVLSIIFAITLILFEKRNKKQQDNYCVFITSELDDIEETFNSYNDNDIEDVEKEKKEIIGEIKKSNT